MNDYTLIQATSCGYELMEQLGRGGFGTVFLARQKSTGQRVAVKMLRLDDVDEQERIRKIERFERETRLCADLHHPNIVRLLDKGRTEDQHLFAVFEYVPGETLKELLLREGTLPALKAGSLMGQVLDGLTCAHAQGIVHRDLKPANIMVSLTGTRYHVRILDFGIGTFVPAARQSDYLSLTLSRETVGTPSYSAPEQLRGEPPTIKSDLYAWGLVFLECLTGRAVMRGATLAEIFHRQLSPDDVPLPPAILGHPLGDLLRRVLHKNQKDRTGRTDQLYHDFQKLNLSSIVGNLNRTTADSNDSAGNIENTETVSPWPMLQIERRQITVLCCSLGLMPVSDVPEHDFEALDALQRDLLSLCTDMGARYGGYLSGSLGDCVMMFFGYPQAGDSDARHAARTALEIAGQIRRRSALLIERQGIRPAFRIGLHSGMVTTCEGSPPTGLTPNTALKLQNLAPEGTVLVSDITHRLLERYIEFEPYEAYALYRAIPAQTFLLTGERQAEAFSFLQTGHVDLPMVGRDAELNALKALWENVAEQHGCAVLLRGEPGIGKSRLTYEMRRFITDSGHRSIVCRCLPEHRNSGLAPVMEMLKSQLHLNEAASTEEAARRLEAVLKNCACRIDWSMPILCSWLSMPLPETFPPVPHSPERQKKILFGVLEELIVNMSHDAPLMIVGEDLHWADQVSLELLDQMMAGLAGTRIMVLLTARPEFSAPWDTEKNTVIELARISPVDSELMIRKLTGDKVVHQSVLDTVYQRTDGVPLFIEELVRLMLDRQYIVEQDGEYLMHVRFDPASVPITLQDLLNEKLGRLGPSRETAQTASVIGREFDYSLLVRVSLRDEASVQTDLDQMAASGLVFRQRRVQGESYIFRHALIRDSAYNSIVQSARSQMHGRIAMALENDFPEQVKADPAGLALHFAEAVMFEKAVVYGTRAANIALERSLNDETLVHANRVLEWIDKLTPEKRPEAELNINGILTRALMGKYGWAAPEVKARINRSRALLEHMELNSYLIPALWALGTSNHVAGNRAEVRNITAKLDEIAKKSEDQGFHSASEMMLGQSFFIDGKYVDAARHLERSLELYDPANHKSHGLKFGLDTRVWALSSLARVKWSSGWTQDAFECGKQASAWAKEINHIPSEGISLMYRGVLHQYAEDKTGAAAISRELIDIGKKYGLPAFEGYATAVHSWADGDAHALLDIVKRLRQIGCMLGLTYYESLYADIEADNGRPDAAVACIDSCLGLCREMGECFYEPELYRRRAKYLHQMNPDLTSEIRSYLVKAAETARYQGMNRTEAMAIQMLIRYGDDTGDLRMRLNEIISMRPELAGFG